MAADFQLKKGDRLPSLQATLVDPTAAADISAATGVTFAMKLQGGTTIVTGAMVVVAAQPAKVRYDWGVADTLTVGIYNAEIVVNFSGKDRTYPNGSFFTVEVVQDVS